ncbi:hypothetical protein CRG98_003404 [Punica granatum]|uniref:Retrotransposon Copia-like N-terminal domain-containing protein n=1 Tax=Punica granatum TaxID=22663 RepID=A0A2I0L641_PUNGR|nr:hypothetical protein CRG98_003404 [Punica granatum]
MVKAIEQSASGGGMPLTYVFTPSDGPDTQLISCKLNGKNYNTRSQAMQTALQAKNKLIFIEGGEIKPRGRPFYDYYGRNGHYQATCYQLHGYLSSNQSNQKNSKGNSSGYSQNRVFQPERLE